MQALCAFGDVVDAAPDVCMSKKYACKINSGKLCKLRMGTVVDRNCEKPLRDGRAEICIAMGEVLVRGEISTYGRLPFMAALS